MNCMYKELDEINEVVLIACVLTGVPKGAQEGHTPLPPPPHFFYRGVKKKKG